MTEDSTSSTDPKAARPLSLNPSHDSQEGVLSRGDETALKGSDTAPDGSQSKSDSAYRKEAEAQAGGGVGNGSTGNHAGEARASKVPAWITDNLKDTHSLKMLFRCWLVTWVAIVVMLPTKSLQTLGQASFFVW